MRKTKKWLKAIRKSNKEKPRNFKHGMSKTRFYRTWVNINRRYNDINGNRWDVYGGKGIECEWVNFETFKKDMLSSYYKHVNKYGEKNTSIDRIDVNNNYSKENCRWATPKEQSNNKKNNVLLTFKGKTLNISQWSDRTGVPYGTIYRRIKKKWSIAKTLTTEPIKKYRNKKYVDKQK